MSPFTIPTFYLHAMQLKLDSIGIVTIREFLDDGLNLPKDARDDEYVFQQLKAIPRRFGRKYNVRVRNTLEALTLQDWEDYCQYAEEYLESVVDEEIWVIGYLDDYFPESLKNVPPLLLKAEPPSRARLPLWYYFRGNPELLKARNVAIVGTETPTYAGFKAAEFFTDRFTKAGFSVVADIASGCGETVIRTALAKGKLVTAFLPCGHLMVENEELAEEILMENGLLLSEYPIDRELKPTFLKERSYQASALADVTVIVQTESDGLAMFNAQTAELTKKPLYVTGYRKASDLNAPVTQGNRKLLDEGYGSIIGVSNIDRVLSDLEKDSNDTWTPFEEDIPF